MIWEVENEPAGRKSEIRIKKVQNLLNLDKSSSTSS